MPTEALGQISFLSAQKKELKEPKTSAAAGRRPTRWRPAWSGRRRWGRASASCAARWRSGRSGSRTCGGECSARLAERAPAILRPLQPLQPPRAGWEEVYCDGQERGPFPAPPLVPTLVTLWGSAGRQACSRPGRPSAPWAAGQLHIQRRRHSLLSGERTTKRGLALLRTRPPPPPTPPPLSSRTA